MHVCAHRHIPNFHSIFFSYRGRDLKILYNSKPEKWEQFYIPHSETVKHLDFLRYFASTMRFQRNASFWFGCHYSVLKLFVNIKFLGSLCLYLSHCIMNHSLYIFFNCISPLVGEKDCCISVVQASNSNYPSTLFVPIIVKKNS